MGNQPPAHQYPSFPHRGLCKEKEDLFVVCGLSAAGVHTHPDHWPCCNHQDRECDCGRLLPRDYCESKAYGGLGRVFSDLSGQMHHLLVYSTGNFLLGGGKGDIVLGKMTLA